MRLKLTSTVAAIALAAPVAVYAADTIKIGVLAPQEGVYTEGGNEGIRAWKLALKNYGDTVGGKKIEWVLGPTDATPETATREARKLIEQEKVDFILGPLSGSEGIALRDYAKTIPDKTIINAASGALETTYVDPAPNFFRFHTEGSQWGYGLGSYVYNVKGWKKVASIAADYSFGYTNFFGFAVDFCKAGGDITDRFWLPLGSGDFASIIAALPDDVDAIYLGVGGTDAINFLNQYQQAGGDTNLIGGSIMVDQTVLSARGRAKEALVGTPSSGPIADDWDNPVWQKFVKDYQETYPDALPSPSLFAALYYGASQAVLLALQEVNGDLGPNQENFKNALANLEYDAPYGHVKLDANHQAIGTVFITEVVEEADGTMHSTYKSQVDNVDELLGMTPEEFAALGLPSRDAVDCQSLHPKQ